MPVREGLADEASGHASRQRDDQNEQEAAASTSVPAMVAAPAVRAAVAAIVRRGGLRRVLRINWYAALRGFHVWVLVDGVTGSALRTVPIMEAKGYAGFSPT